MARTDLEQLMVQLSADVSGYQKAMDKAMRATNRAAFGIEGRWRKANKNISGSLAGIKSLGGGLLAGGVAGLVSTQSLRQIGSLVKSVADLADEAERAGVSFEQLQELGFAASQNGVEVDKLTDALKKLNLEVGEAQTKGNDLGKIFAANKLTFSTDPAENFRKVAELIQNARTEQEKAVIGAAAFGKAYGDLIPLLNLGEDGIRKMEQAARDLGAVMSNDVGKAAQEFDDKLDAIATVLETRVKAGTVAILRDMRDLVTAAGEFADKMAGAGAGVGAMGQSLKKALQFNVLTGPPLLFLERYFSGKMPPPLFDPSAQKLVDLTERRKLLEAQIAELIANGNNAGVVIMRRQLDILNEQIAKLELQRGPSFETFGRGSPSPATVVPSSLDDAANKLDGAAHRLEEVIDKFARDVVVAESGGRADAKNPLSSATGVGQFIEATWLRLFRENFPDRAKGMTDAAVLALRTDAQISFELIKAYARENATVLKAAGVSVTEANLQLSHFLGAQGAIDVLKAAPGTPVAQVLPQNVISANQGMLGGGATVDDVIRYAEARTRAAEADKAGKKSFDDLMASHRESIGEQKLENELFGQTSLAAEQARIEYQLLAEAKRALGRELLPDEVAKIKATAVEMANLKIESVQLAEAQEKIAEQMRQAQEAAAETARQLESAFAGAMKGFISDLIHGKSLTDSLRDALTNLADQLVSLALDNLFKGLFSGGLGGGGGLFGSLFHAGAQSAGTGGPKRKVSGAAFLGAPRYHEGGFAGFKPGEIPAILKRGEPVGPAAVEAAARRVMAIAGSSRTLGGRGPQTMVVNNTFTAPGMREMHRSQNQLARRAAADLERAMRTK